LAVAGALVSALSNLPLPADLVSFGEVGLGGEVRAVGQRDQRIKEAAKLGFARALVPPRRKKTDAANDTLELKEVGHLHDLVAFLGVETVSRRRGA